MIRPVLFARRYLFIAVSFLGAFLLFLTEPLVTKSLLPLFGGSASLWATSLGFFQLLLLCGYAYAHWLSRQRWTRQIWIHSSLLCFSLFSVPPVIWGGPRFLRPPLSVFVSLAVAIGLPFFALSSHLPLLQTWLARRRQSGDPYRLSVPSNVGCILALLFFPFVAEPRFGLHALHRAWSFGYGLLLVLLAGCVLMTWRTSPPEEPVVESPKLYFPSTAQEWKWISLSFLPAALLTSITLYLCTQIAPLPLLCLLPLILYLTTFVIVFSRGAERIYPLVVSGVPIAAAVWILSCLLQGVPLGVILVVQLGSFFWLTLACHGTLAQHRPPTEGLTKFFLDISIGGALGGLMAGIVAPALFKGLLEFPLLILAIVGIVHAQTEWLSSKGRLFAGAVFAMVSVTFLSRVLQETAWSLWGATTIGLATVFLASPKKWPYFAGALLGVPLIPCFQVWHPFDRVIYADRSFYGIHRVYVNKKRNAFWLSNGTTVHGGQWLIPAWRRRPFAYYDASGPLGDIFRFRRPDWPTARVGVVGLGTGGMTAYAHGGEAWTYFEIDDAVIKLATDSRLFTYLRDCPAPVRVVRGDARLSLAHEKDHAFDILIIDAFGSDWIPSHLLTREAIVLYRQKLSPDGLLVIHVSNQYVNLWPVIASEAEEAHLSIARKQRVTEDKDAALAILGSRWVAITADARKTDRLIKEGGWQHAHPGAGARVWTDDLSSIVGLFNW
jgi:hypothetical protein